MTTYNTGNPVGSTDARDLYDNSQALDELVNGSGTYSNRLGVQRRTLAKLEADFDTQLADAESDLNVYRSEAAASAAEAFGYLQAYRATSYGALAEDPIVDPLGNPPTEGDEYFSTSAKLLKRWNGTNWQASDISTANLASPTGDMLIGTAPGPGGRWSTLRGFISTLLSGFGASVLGYKSSGTGAVDTTVKQVLDETVSVFRFMTPEQIADAKSMNPTMDLTTAFATGVAVLRQRGGGSLIVPHARYLLNGAAGADGIKNGILLPFTGGSDTRATAISINLIFEDRDTTLVAGSNDMIMIRCSTSYSEISSFQIDENGKTGVIGLALIPENTTTPAANSQQSHNHIHDFHIGGCAEGIVLQSGDIGGAYYNHIGPGQVYGNGAAGNGGTGNTRGVYLKPGINGASPPNRNHFVSVRVGKANTGFHIESGDTNRFTGCSVEGITHGSLPNAVPTGLKVGGGSQATQGSMFYGFIAESCTRDAEILDPRTQFFGFILDAGKTILAADFVSSGHGTMIGSYDATVFPNIYAGTIEYGSQLPSGIGTYEYGSVRNNKEFFDKGYKYKSFALTTSNIGNVASISESKSHYTKLANMVDWSFRFQFKATAGNSVITIPLPLTAELQAYATYNTMPPFVFLVRVTYGANEAVGFAEVNFEAPAGTYLKVRLPAGATWALSGNDNMIHGQIRYRAA